MARKRALSQNVEYIYFSDRLARRVEEQALGRASGALEYSIEVAAQPFGVGVKGEAAYKTSDHLSSTLSPASRGQGLRDLLADLTVEGFDPNGVAEFVHGESTMWWGSWFVKHDGLADTKVAYFGSAYTAESGRDVLLCLFGSRNNLLGFFGNLEESRIFGWTASTVWGIESLLTLANPNGPATSIELNEDQAFQRLSEANESDLVMAAAQIVIEQGIEGHGGEDLTYKSENRGYVIGEGTLEWLARAYIWHNEELAVGRRSFDTVVIGAPIWIRTASARPLSQFGPVYRLPGGGHASTAFDPRTSRP